MTDSEWKTAGIIIVIVVVVVLASIELWRIVEEAIGMFWTFVAVLFCTTVASFIRFSYIVFFRKKINR